MMMPFQKAFQYIPIPHIGLDSPYGSMSSLKTPADLSPSLQLLANLDSFVIQQLDRKTEQIRTNRVNQYANQYCIKTECSNVHLMLAREETSRCGYSCCGHQRSYKIHVQDVQNRELFSTNRAFMCCGGCFGCMCPHDVVVRAPCDGEILGYVMQRGTFLQSLYDIRDVCGESLFELRAPCCVLTGPCICCDTTFRLYKTGCSSPCGEVVKEYGGCVGECCSRTDTLRAKFPIDLPVRIKALLIAAIFQLHFTHYERSCGCNCYNAGC